VSVLVLLLSACMFLVAILFSMLGQGGGTLYTPIQVFFGIDFHVAATTSLFLIIVTSLSATLVFRRANRVDWPLSAVLESVALVGAFAGGWASETVSAELLAAVFAGVISVAALFMIRDQPMAVECFPGRTGFLRWRRRPGTEEYCVNLLLALPASALAGWFSGLVGVGGGVFMVPLMILLLGVPADIAIGSSAFMVGVTAIGGFSGHLLVGHWDWRTSLVLGGAAFLGGQIGARSSLRIDKGKIKRGFGWFLFAIAAVMILKVVR